MKCQNCGQNEANFFQHSNINGYETETHLCSACAEQLGAMNGFSAPMPRMFEEFFGMQNRMLSPFGPFMPQIGPRAVSPGTAVTAPRDAAPVQQQVVEVDETMSRQREINILREQMKSAADAEDFERAMTLREEIKRLEA